MMLPSFFCEIVTVSRAPLISSRGASERDWSAAQAHEVPGCFVEPISTSQARTEPRDGYEDSAMLYAPPGADIERGDRVTCASGTFSVDGTPLAVGSPTGMASHVRVQLVRWAG